MERIGKIRVSREVLESGGAFEIMKRISVLSVKYIKDQGMYEFVAISAHFEPVEEDIDAPFYEVKFALPRPELEFNRIE